MVLLSINFEIDSRADVESGLDMASLPDEESSLSAQRSLILYIDIYRIEQVIRNLITNAVRQHLSSAPSSSYI